MSIKFLPLKRAVRTALLVLLLNVVGLTKGYAYDFSAVCSTGQTLYYNITDADNHYVALVAPGGNSYYGWNGFTKPTGDIIFPESVQNDGVTYIVTSIDYYAFNHCSDLTGNLTIPNSVITIGNLAFWGCSGFTGSLIIPNSVTTIGNQAFDGCSGFTGSLTIPNSVTTIGGYAFEGCSGFTGSLTIPNSVTSIGGSAFENCSGFTGNLTIPNSVTTIPRRAFYGCSGLSGDLVIPNSVTYIGENSFYNCSGLTGNLVIPNSVTTIEFSAFQYCSGFTGSLIIPNSVTTIGGYAFYHCSGFAGDLIIPNSVMSIGGNAFCGCSGFTGNLTIPNSVTSIDYGAFYGCSGFTGNLTIPNSVTSIDYGAFYGCSGFAGDLIIPNSVATIGEMAFQYCSGFTGSLTIPNSVTDIGLQAFYGCSGITEIYSGNINPPTLESTTVFGGVDKSIPVHVPCGALEDYSNAYGWSQFTNYQGIPAIITVVANPESLGYAEIIQYGTCDNPESAVEAYPYYSEFTNQPYEFINWTVDGVEVSTDPYYTFELTEDIDLVANFGPGPSHVFVGGNSNLWSDAENWLPQELPNEFSTVEILANVQVDGEATAANVNMPYGYGIVMTIQPEGVLTVTESLNGFSDWEPSVIIEDGGQLYHPNEYVNAMVKKAITPYTPGQKDGWHLIAHPMENDVYVYDVENLSNNEYDLYYYDEPTVYWINQENTENNYTTMEAGKGYLYGNSQSVTLSFSGYLQNGSAEVNVPLSYTTGHPLQGFNLVGNPFAHNVTSYASVNVANGCYVMNEAKDDLIVSEISEENPLKPAEGFFVKATAAGASITFNPGRGSTATQSGTIRVELAENGKLIDRLLVKTAEGQPLEKFSLNERRTRLFAQGEHQELAIVPCEGNEQAVNFKAVKNGNYTISVNVGNMDFNYLHLIDNLTGEDVDLLAKPSYTFEAKTSDYVSRFLLRFIPNDSSTSTDNFAFISNGNIVITDADADATLQIVDVTGRVVVSSDAARNVSTSGMSAGVYVLRLINGNDVRTQKIVVE